MAIKYPPEHYPISGIQHTRAVMALTAAQLCMDTFKPQEGTGIARHMDKINEAIASCGRITKTKRLSAGAKRDLDNGCITLAQYVNEMRDMGKDALFTRWSALVWSALTFVEDALNTCPQWTKTGTHEKKWQALRKSMSDLADGLRELEPRMDEIGTAIYETTAWALEGVVFAREVELC